jgi:N,N'-diacetyllegionaminate synthase
MASIICFMTFIIAEIGVNWDGDFQLVKEIMIESKKNGCDAVKFQSYTHDMIKSHPEHERLIKSSISKDNIDEIDNIAKHVGIEWFCTPMYPEAVDLLNPYVKRFKIRESDSRILLKNETSDIIDNVLSTKKEIIASSESNPINSKYYDKIKWLYCIPKYPCNLSDLSFGHLDDYFGYSNHCPNIIAPLTAAILGSKIIEIHITSSKSKNFIDNPVSFDYGELRQLTKMIRDFEKISIDK